MPKGNKKASGPRPDTARLVQMLEDYRWGVSQQRRREFSKSQMAAFLGLSKQTYLGWYAGARPRPDALWRVADLTGLDADELFRAAGYPETPHRPRTILDAALEAAQMHPEEDRERLMQFARELFARYEAGQRGTDAEAGERPRERVSAG